MPGKKLLFSEHIFNRFQRTTIPRLKIESLTASYMNRFHYLSLQFEALVIYYGDPLHFCSKTSTLKLSTSSVLSKKHGIATFVDEQIRYTLLDRSPPISPIECLCVDVDGSKIVNFYKSPPIGLRPLDPQCFFISVSMSEISIVELIEVTIITVLTVNVWLTWQVLIVLSFYIILRMP